MTQAQIKFLEKIGDGADVYAPRLATLRALRDQGLLCYQYIGMRWWRAVPTKAGKAAARSSDPGGVP